MVISLKDAAKLAGITIISFCAVLVCTLFLNFNIDIAEIRDLIDGEQNLIFYEAQVSTAKVVSIVSGGCLLITSVIMLIFYVGHYIDSHKKELGILKAIGYSDFSTARSFGVFGISVFIGTALGFGGAFLIMPNFYEIQNADGFLPEFKITFHPVLLICLVIVPTLFFAALSVFFAFIKLKMPVMSLLKDAMTLPKKLKKIKNSSRKELSFIDELRRNTLKSRKVLVFFIFFASFCFSSMMQMSFSMKKLASIMMSIMILMIGIVLACTTLFLAVTTVVNGSRKTIAMMRVFGYSQKECSHALLSGYDPAAYIGFAVGTIYQYGLLRIMVDVVFKDMDNIPVYEFNVLALIVSLGAFIVLYKLIMFCYSEKIKNISVKEIMLE